MIQSGLMYNDDQSKLSTNVSTTEQVDRQGYYLFVLVWNINFAIALMIKTILLLLLDER